ncbi:MAG: hypothetical protein K2K50_02130, partial [Anaeroplasmataceae bacterium]|nr:hypothetical protein [Anaeroplasmataceae bacterium]
DYINQDIVKTPYFLPYDFATIVIFFQGDFYNISTLLNELLSIDFSIYLEFKNPKIALLKYNEIVSKYDLPFSFNDIFPFEDYYEYKIFNKGDYYGVPKA